MVDASIRTLDTESSVPAVESFLIGLSPVVIETKLESKMRRLLNKYRERKSKEIDRKKEWQLVNAEKPNPEMDHPTDKNLIEEAKRTIGNYKLKTDENYEATEEERETVSKKLQELIKTREDVYNIRNEYNQKIHALRNKKKALIDYINRKLKKLNEIHLEIPQGQRMRPKIIVTCDFDREFPERNFDLKKYLSPEIYEKDLISVASGVNIKTLRDCVEKHLMNVQRGALKDETTVETIAIRKSSNLNLRLFQKAVTDDKNTSEWEEELKNHRTRRRLFEQQQIIKKISVRIQEFDEEVEMLSDERYAVEVKAKYKELYLLTLNNELMILKDFETTEDNLIETVDNKDMERKNLAGRISQTNVDIEASEKALEEMTEAKQKIEQKFKANCSENKFFPFLKKIFRVKLQLDDEELIENEAEDDEKESVKSSISSSNNSSVNDGVGMKHLSQDECPKACDRKLYDLTFELRQERHEMELAMNRKENDIEMLRSDVSTMTERLEKTEQEYESNKKRLSELRRQKQQMLNEVPTVVCLKMDQMQYFKNQAEFEDINNTLLFNNQNVTKLYSRVAKLALETIEAKRKHRINVIHLAKMKTDIKFMETQITDLKDGTSQAMLKKFGRVIDLNEVEETILRRFAFEMQVEMRANAEDIKKQYFNKINELKKTKIFKEETLSRVTQEATEKLNILTVLEEEKNFLHRIISLQNRKKEKRSSGLPHREVANDLGKLKEISNHQREQIEMLQREIRALSLKTKSFVDARQDFESLNYSIRQLGGECRFEDSICSNPDESMLSSTRATTPDNEVYNEVLRIVKTFAESNLGEQLEEIEVENISLNLAKYLTNIAVNFSTTETEEILPEVINSFSNFLPKHIRIAPENIAELIANIIGNINNGNEVNRSEVLKEIINSTIESANLAAISSNFYLQHIIIEIFKQMVITMRFSDISSPDCTLDIIERLSKLNEIQTKSVNVEEVVDHIVEHANENMEDDIDSQVLKRIISNILSKLSFSPTRVWVKLNEFLFLIIRLCLLTRPTIFVIKRLKLWDTFEIS